MGNDLQEYAIWTFSAPCEIPKDIQDMLVTNEKAMYAYKTIRDVAIFTDRRLIVRDAQGITGKKVEVYTLPYSSIIMYSTENSGKLLDVNSEVELWTKVGKIKINLNKQVNIREIDKLLATYILQK
ncbi:hypothetical protein C809_02866 [Lachnospiraceae bacterium MD335]|jgi:hypothetical protein|nr:hypothetical protein C809_02866 [Lachnospiraceae bacterium MD335]